MDGELDRAVVVEFPLRGEPWVAVNTPGDRIPSHGVDMLGQRYAYDLLKVDERTGVHYHPAGWFRMFVLGGRTQECYAWGRRFTHLSTVKLCAQSMEWRNGPGSIQFARPRWC